MKKVKLELYPVPDPNDPDQPDWIEVPAIMGCYMCAIDQFPHGELDVFDDEAAKAFPRNVVDEYTTPGFDPTAVYTLSCGHDII